MSEIAHPVGARRVLLADAGYCGVAAVVLLAGAAPLAASVGVPAAVLIAAGALVAGWAVLLVVLSRVRGRRRALLAVAAVNAVAVLALVALGVSRPGEAVGVLFLLVAAEVGAFALVQLALARRRSDHTRERH